MKTVKIFLMALVAVCGMIVSGADMPVKKMSVEAVMTAVPDVAYRNHSAFTPKNPSVNKWLMIKVKYTMDSCSSFTPEVKYSRQSGVAVSFPGWLENVELRVQVIFDTGVSVKSVPVRVLFTGSSVFHSIKRNGKEHLAVMFVPAKVLDRYCSHWGGAAKVSKGMFSVKAEMFVGGRALATAFSSNIPGKSESGKDTGFEKMLKLIPKQLSLDNAVLPRSRSPWALLSPDDYDWEVDKSVGSVQE